MGQRVVAWTRQIPGDATHVRAAFYSASGAQTQLQDFGPATTVGEQGTAALDSLGRSWIVWPNGPNVTALRGYAP